jgi:molybdopterin/thiamine biosynthesis adenylyltransferase
VLVVGAGGLGCPAAAVLAASGVGSLALADPDQVDLTNLHRQLLYRTADVGRPKVGAAVERLRRIYPTLAVEGLSLSVDATNAERVFRSADLVVERGQ